MTRIIIVKNTSYEIQVQRFVWFMWRMVDQHRRATKFSACRLAHGISKGRIKIIDKTIMKTFKEWNDECPRCGDSCKVLTSAQDGFTYDGDLVQCNDCGLEGSILCDGDENDNGDSIASVSWNDFED